MKKHTSKSALDPRDLYLLVDRKPPYLPLDFAYSLKELSEKYGYTYHRICMAMRRGSILGGLYYVELVKFIDDSEE